MTRIPSSRPVSLSAPAEHATGVVVIQDPQDSNVPLKATKGDLLRVQLLAQRWGVGLWTLVSQSGSVGKLTDRGLVGEFQVFEWDTKDVKPGRFQAQFQRPGTPRDPARVFVAVVDISAPKATQRQ